MSQRELQLNGEKHFTESATLSALLRELSLENKKVAVELNRVIVPRENYATTPLQNGDELEIIHFVGGG